MYIKQPSSKYAAFLVARNISSAPNLPRLPTVLICILIAIGVIFLTIMSAYLLRDHDWRYSTDESSTKRRVALNFGTPDQMEEDQKRMMKKGWSLDGEATGEPKPRVTSSSQLSHKSRKSFYQFRQGNTSIQSMQSPHSALSEATKARLGVGKKSQSSPGYPTILKSPQRTEIYAPATFEMQPTAPIVKSRANNPRNPHRESESLTPAQAHARLRAVQEEGTRRFLSTKENANTLEESQNGGYAASEAGVDNQIELEVIFKPPPPCYTTAKIEGDLSNGIYGVTEVVSERVVRQGESENGERGVWVSTFHPIA